MRSNLHDWVLVRSFIVDILDFTDRGEYTVSK